MADSYEILAVEDAETWDSFVRQAIGGSVFSTWTWLECARQAIGGQPCGYGCYKNGRLVAGVSGLAHRRGGLQRLITPLLTPTAVCSLPRCPAKAPPGSRPSRIAPPPC